jgi:hypothetical protein
MVDDNGRVIPSGEINQSMNGMAPTGVAQSGELTLDKLKANLRARAAQVSNT